MRFHLVGPHSRGWSEDRVGRNFNGPSLVRRPDWLRDAPGEYLLFFAHHQGRSIRLAFADEVTGPYRIHPPGVLPLEQTPFSDHIASPDVHIDHDRQQLVMYFHGAGYPDIPPAWEQATCLATSNDGLRWVAEPTMLCPSYLRAFHFRQQRYGVAMPGVFYRMTDGWGGLEPSSRRIAGPLCGVDDAEVHLHRKARHFATRVVGERLELYFSRVGDAPECILRSDVELPARWHEWTPGPTRTVLKPVHDWEGARLPVEPSRGGAVHRPVHQLRDPAIFEDEGRVFLLYSAAGESGIGMVKLP